MRGKPLIHIILFIFLWSSVCANIKEDVAKAVVRVRSGNKYSTGFFWQNGTQVVTTMHSIANPNDIEIYIPTIGAWKKVQVKKSLKNSDLVLLQSSYWS